MNITIVIDSQDRPSVIATALRRLAAAYDPDLLQEAAPAPAPDPAPARPVGARILEAQREREAYEAAPQAEEPQEAAPAPAPTQEAEEEEEAEEEAAPSQPQSPTPTPTPGAYNELTRDQLKALIRSRKIMGRVPEAVSAEQLRELLRNYDQRHATAPAPALALAPAPAPALVEEPEPEPAPAEEPEPEPVQEEEEEDWSPGIGEKVNLTYQGASVTGTIQEIKYEEHRLIVRIPAGLVKIAPEKCTPIK